MIHHSANFQMIGSLLPWTVYSLSVVSEKAKPLLEFPDLIRLTAAAALTVLIALLSWEVLARNFSSTLEGLHYMREVAAGSAVAIVIGVMVLRKAFQVSAQLRESLATTNHQLAETEDLLDVVMEASPSAVMVLNTDRSLQKANRVALQVHKNLTVGEIYSPLGERCQICPGCDALLTTECTMPARELTDPQTGAVLSVACYPTKLADGKAVAVIVEEIITKQKKLQASLVHQEKMAAFGLVAAGVAHEMGNPLSSIEMHLQLFDVSAMNDEDSESIATLRRETARLRRTLRELVDFARRRRSDATSVSVDAVIRDALQLLRYDPRMRKVVVEFNAAPEIPAVNIVEDHLMQVMVNLLINSIDAMPDGGELRIDSRHVGDQVAIRVRDSGVGMTKEVKDRCFEPLFSTKEAGKGTGLGLSICRDVLSAAGGTIELHSAPSRGTTVVVTLAAEPAEGVGAGKTTAQIATVAEDAALLRHTDERAIVPLHKAKIRKGNSAAKATVPHTEKRPHGRPGDT